MGISYSLFVIGYWLSGTDLHLKILAIIVPQNVSNLRGIHIVSLFQ